MFFIQHVLLAPVTLWMCALTCSLGYPGLLFHSPSQSAVSHALHSVADVEAIQAAAQRAQGLLASHAPRLMNINALEHDMFDWQFLAFLETAGVLVGYVPQYTLTLY
jgi:hypothetical protein